MHKPRFSVLSALLSAGRVIAGSLMPDRSEPTGQRQLYHLASGKNYVSRSRYTPGGPNRNCGARGISPKSVKRALLRAAA